MAERTTYTPAFYARRGGVAADWWTLLHPPYTVWHLSYVVLGAAMAPALDWTALGLAVLAFFLAVGVAAHALDELQGRPLGTGIGDGLLRAVASLALLAACALGVYGVLFHAGLNVALAVAVPVGAVLVVGYNLELFGGRLHNDRTFAWGWGGFPVAVGYVAQAPGLVWSSVAAAVAAVLAGVGTSYAQRRLSTPARTLRRRTSDVTGTVTSYAQRRLSTPARTLRRRTSDVTGTVTDADGRAEPLDRAALLAPLEGALRALSWAVPVVALATLLSRV